MKLNPNRKNIIITLSDGGYRNLGDEWLHESVKTHYAEMVTKYNIICMMSFPRSNVDGELFYYIKDDLSTLQELNLSIDSIELVHFSGGGYINSYWMKEKMWLYDYLMKEGLSPRKVVFTGAGLGPFTDEEFKYVKDISETVRLFGVRDRIYDKELPKTKFTFDETIALAPRNPKINSRKKKVLVNCRIADHVGVDENGAIDLVRIVEDFANKSGRKTKYFSMVNNKNLREHREINKALFKAGVIGKLSKKKRSSYRQLLDMVSGVDLVVATSYHAVLAALYVHTPVVAVLANEYYDKKFFGLKGVLNTDLLTVKLAKDLKVEDLDLAVDKKDDNIGNKLAELKRINEEVYQTYIKSKQASSR